MCMGGCGGGKSSPTPKKYAGSPTKTVNSRRISFMGAASKQFGSPKARVSYAHKKT